MQHGLKWCSYDRYQAELDFEARDVMRRRHQPAALAWTSIAVGLHVVPALGGAGVRGLLGDDPRADRRFLLRVADALASSHSARAAWQERIATTTAARDATQP